jgi:uncharacterized protein (TIGR03086 family)
VSNEIERHRRSIDELGRRVNVIEDKQWDLGTPCAGWDVRDLLQHITEGNLWVRPLVEGKTIAEVGDSLSGDHLGAHPQHAWRDSAMEAQTAFESDGAMERIVHLSFGDVPGAVYAEQRWIDNFVHAWDLARAIGAEEDLDPDLVEAAAEWAEKYRDMLVASGAYGDKLDVPDDADPQTRLLLLFGRTP